MALLHVLRSAPDKKVRRLIASLSGQKQNRVIALFHPAVDYDELLRRVFEADRVICWW